jgi:hypothetical protein
MGVIMDEIERAIITSLRACNINVMKMDQTIPESILTLRRIGHTFVFASFE